MFRSSILETVARDARYALRLLGRTPAFTVTAVLTLGMAIGVNTAVFSVVDGVLLKPLPYADPNNLALVQRTVRDQNGQHADTAVDGRTWEAVRDRAAHIRCAAFSDWATGVNLVAPSSSGSARAVYVQQQRVGTGFFGVLGIAAALGREFNADEDRAGGPPASVLSGHLWRSLFNADPAVIGRTIVLRGEPYAIVGVMPDGFRTGVAADLWTPLRPSITGEGSGENYQILARVLDARSALQAGTELAAIARELAAERTPATSFDLSLVPLQQGLTESLRQPLLMLWAAVGVVLLVACVNLAGLLLARTAGRTRELATRMALGSGRSVLIRQLLVESLVLAILGGTAGIAVGFAALDALKWLARDAFAIWQPVALDARAIGVAAVLAVIAVAIFGVAPAAHASGLDVQSALTSGGARGIAGTSARWPRRVLVIAQVAMGVVLLVSAGLLLRTFTHLRGLAPGFDTAQIVTASISLDDARYRTKARVVRLFDETLARLGQTPGIDSAAVALGLPYERLLNLGFRHMDGPEASAQGEMTSAAYVSADFFHAMRVPIRRGRSFSAADRDGAPAVAIINETFARSYFRSDPIGRHIRVAGAEREIIGVAGDVPVRPGWGDNGPVARMPLTYVPVAQMSEPFMRLVHGWFAPAFVVRSALPFDAATTAIRRALDSVDPLLPLARVRPIAEVQAAAISQQRFLTALLAGLAVAAVLLAAIGLHGLIATSVTERTREMGIRLALGASRQHALTALVLPGVLLAGTGTLIGLAAARATTPLLRHFIWGTTTTDPITFVGVGALLLLVATTASLAPALKILHLDPAATLRQD